MATNQFSIMVVSTIIFLLVSSLIRLAIIFAMPTSIHVFQVKFDFMERSFITAFTILYHP